MRAKPLGGIRTEEGRWVVGTGEPPTGDPQAAYVAAVPSGPPANRRPELPVSVRLQVPAFELFRAATGRRSRTQIRRYRWSEAPEPYMALFDLWPFHRRDNDLVE